MIKLILKTIWLFILTGAFVFIIGKCLAFICNKERKEKTDYILPIVVMIFSIMSIYSILGEIPLAYEKYQRQGAEYKIFN